MEKLGNDVDADHGDEIDETKPSNLLLQTDLVP